MKILLLLIFLLIFPLNLLLALDRQGLQDGYTLIVGPRIGVGYVMESKSQYKSFINQQMHNSEDYYPVNSMFGVSLEQQVLLGDTKDHFAFQEIFSINGLEQALALPVAACLAGYRSESGFEAGIGPLLSLSGIQIVGAVGWTFEYHGVHVPIDVSVAIPNNKAAGSISLTTGFNFQTSSFY